ncbi:MAG: PAS domain-containing protein [Muribaculaceae bacterium]|nr:PAS domain-containing protein [Muribaculaceae bacterium]
MRILFALVALLTAGVAIALPFFMRGMSLYVLEAVLGVVLISLILLYRSVISPMGALDRGINLLKAQDFASRLSHVDYAPADRIVDTFNSMMMQLRSERLRVREQNQFLDLLVDASPMGIIVLGFDGTVSSANPAAVQLLASPDLKGRRLADIPGELAAAIAALRHNQSETVRLGDTRMFRCSRLSLLDSGHQRPFILIESLTEELLEAERSSYGKLIRTIVHEVNNTLAGVLPLIDTCAMISGDEAMEDAACSCTERCNALSAFIGNFADVVKIGQPDRKDIDINEFLLTLRPFLESLASGRGVELKYSLDAEMAPVSVDTVQFEQVVVNIVKNAIESIGTDGTVEIVTDAASHTLTIADNGAGISPEAAGKLFSPFFSTKKSGQGIGLTLSAEILRAHRFDFSLATSQTDGITRFSIKI